MTLSKRAAATLGALLISAAGLVGAAVPAAAATGDSGYVPEFTRINQCPWSACSYWVTSYGTWFPFDCWKDTADYPGAPSLRWFRASGNVGWIRAKDVTSQPSLPRC